MVGFTETGHHEAGTIAVLLADSDSDRLSCLSHLGLSLVLQMVCFALFFFCVLGPVIVMAPRQSCMLVSEWSLSERLGGGRQTNMVASFFPCA